jgi:hypothetical protein
MQSGHDSLIHWSQHLLIGALVPVGIYVEPAIEEALTGHNFEVGRWRKIAIVIVLYCLTVALLWLISEGVERLRRSVADRKQKSLEESKKREADAPILLHEVDDITGHWVDAVYANKQLVQGSIIEFRSKQKEGFIIKGFTYDFIDGELKLDQPHDFKASVTFAFADQTGIAYMFEGTEFENQEGIRHDGAGFYEFKLSDRNEKRFTGAFFIASKQQVRTVSGLYIGPRKSQFERTQRLRDFLIAEKNRFSKR